MSKFSIVKDTTRMVRNFNLQGRTLEFKIKPVPVGEDPVGWVKEAINQIIQRATENLSSEDQVSFSFCSKDFARGDGWVRFRPMEQVTYDDVWNVISSTYQSNSTGLNTETFCLGVTSVRMPARKGRGKKYNTFEEECEKRRSTDNSDMTLVARPSTSRESQIQRQTHTLKEAEGQKRVTRKRCSACYKNMSRQHNSAYARKNAKKVNTVCEQCEQPMCIACFKNHK
ncbi:uncharacterized protein LOC108913681 [Anoplophora glabripennis]|uniref:uncharacterized protein LOC108913681 n=1 Tax=Anoplophora glabripennis TaxID=217634 RepID=UPI0008737AF9|nr:uncharacterized protein LOC108913681 [Anoplophora glabripennis]